MGKIRKYGSHRRWTKEEEEKLEIYCGKYSTGEIARKLKRSESSVRCKRMRMEVPNFFEQTDKLTGAEIGRLVGMDKSNIYRTWVEKGLKVQMVGRNKMVSEEQLVEFMKEHQELWKASKCDYYYFCRYKWFKDRLQRERNGLESYDNYKNFKHWTTKDISRVRMLKQRGLTHREIADEVGRSKQAIDHLSRKFNEEKSKKSKEREEKWL